MSSVTHTNLSILSLLSKQYNPVRYIFLQSDINTPLRSLVCHSDGVSESFGNGIWGYGLRG